MKKLIAFILTAAAAVTAQAAEFRLLEYEVANVNTGTIVSTVNNVRGEVKRIDVDLIESAASTNTLALVAKGIDSTGPDVTLFTFSAAAADVSTNISYLLYKQDLELTTSSPLGLSNTVKVKVLLEK